MAVHPADTPETSLLAEADLPPRSDRSRSPRRGRPAEEPPPDPRRQRGETRGSGAPGSPACGPAPTAQGPEGGHPLCRSSPCSEPPLGFWERDQHPNARTQRSEGAQEGRGCHRPPTPPRTWTSPARLPAASFQAPVRCRVTLLRRWIWGGGSGKGRGFTLRNQRDLLVSGENLVSKDQRRLQHCTHLAAPLELVLLPPPTPPDGPTRKGVRGFAVTAAGKQVGGRGSQVAELPRVRQAATGEAGRSQQGPCCPAPWHKGQKSRRLFKYR